MATVSGNLFVDIGLTIIIAATAAFILRYLKQPNILAYVLTGIILTPVLHLVTDTSIIESMSIVGIAFLLFIVGLEMDLSSLKNVALVSGFGGLIQIIILFILGYLVSFLLGYLSIEAAYIGLMIAFSSTMVVLKLLSDKRELNTLHGRLSIGILLVQDIVAILALSILSSINQFNYFILAYAFLKFATLFLVAYITSKFIFPHMFRFAAKNQELLLITSLAVCFTFSLAFFYLGFSIAVGAFLAGIALGNLEYNLQIIGRIKSLKDFFSLIFFVSLGMGISLSVIKEQWLTLLVLLIVVMVIKPFVIMTICSLFRYTKKPSFLTANALAQVGEFSLILAAQGLILNHISKDLFSIIVVLTLITIVLTSYYIEYNQFFYKFLKVPLKIFDRFTTEGLEFLPTQSKPKIILCGYNRIGYSILRDLKKVKKKVMIIDFNPEVISEMVKEGYHCMYGDATDEEIIERMNLDSISIFISTIPREKDNLLLIKHIRGVNKRAKILVTASAIEESLRLYDAGADYVILPHFLGGEHVSHLITNLRAKKLNLKEERKKHIEHLHLRTKGKAINGLIFSKL
ncbi:MAG: cation:proton antiporter [archaeon]|nr:cation:proton antiporter [archaeon]